MTAPLFYFVKPHPPKDILHRETPLKENYKYDWEPLVLKYLVWTLQKQFPKIKLKIWHLITEDDDQQFLQAVKDNTPLSVFFTEIDILVNPVNELAQEIKKIDNSIITAVGGKQSSLLQVNDRMPFGNIDFVISGDGVAPLIEITSHILNNRTLCSELFLSWNRSTRKITSTYNNQRDKTFPDLPAAYRFIPVENHTETGYITLHQKQPVLNPEKSRTAPLLIGTGCPYDCIFCQSPLEFGKGKGSYLMRSAKIVAEEIAALKDKWQVNNLFSLESNINFAHLQEIYLELEKLGIDSFPVSGFVRISDILAAYESGLLSLLAQKGMRVLHTGIDIILNNEKDVYNKDNSLHDIRTCLEYCKECGIIVIATYIGNPASTAKEFKKQLERLAVFPVADIDIRLAIALRNTDYFREVEKYLLYHPNKDQHYFDVQNYRFQTIQMPKKITPKETYQIVNDFFSLFYLSEEHIGYIKVMIKRHPDTKDFFIDQYKQKDIRLPDEISV